MVRLPGLVAHRSTDSVAAKEVELVREQWECVIELCGIVHETNSVASILILMTANPSCLEMNVSTRNQHLFNLT